MSKKHQFGPKQSPFKKKTLGRSKIAFHDKDFIKNSKPDGYCIFLKCKPFNMSENSLASRINAHFFANFILFTDL